MYSFFLFWNLQNGRNKPKILSEFLGVHLLFSPWYLLYVFKTCHLRQALFEELLQGIFNLEKNMGLNNNQFL